MRENKSGYIGVIKYIALFAAFLIVLTGTAMNTSAGYKAQMNDDDSITISTVDKVKSSKTFYKTKGVTITRCCYNPTSEAIHSTNEWFETKFDDEEPELINGYYYTDWTISYDKIVTYARGVDPKWAEEIEKAHDGTGPSVCIKLDCIMYIYLNGKTPVGPYKNAPGVYGGDGNKSTGINAQGKEIGDFGWKSPDSLKTHFNHYLYIGKDIYIPVPAGDYKIYGGDSTTQPDYQMGNYSNKFNLEKGIPTNEEVINKYTADSWWGYTDIYARTVSHHYTHDITYHWTEKKTVEDGYKWVLKKGKWVKETQYKEVDDPKSKTVTLDIGNAYVAYEYLNNANFYDFISASINNDVYPGESISYNEGIRTPVSCISSNSYVDMSTVHTSAVNWTPDDNRHVMFPPINYVKDVNVSRESDIEQAKKNNIAAIRGVISASCKSKNDRLVIDGKVILSDYEETGCNFADTGVILSYTDCTASASAKRGYGKGVTFAGLDPDDDFDSKAVTIPKTVSNGTHTTGMSVRYQRIIPNDYSVRTFSPAGSIKPGNVISAYLSNEPVLVHTPVTAEATVKDRNKNDLTNANQLVNPSGANHLRLDNQYYLHWENIGHADKDGYRQADEGGYNKYDKYVESKWVRFPFEVCYENRFYELNGTHTEWIEIKKPSVWTESADTNHWIDTPFYIPTYAKEGVGNIEYKVLAQNVEDDYEDHSGNVETGKNNSEANYVAVGSDNAELSGYVYDFTITGSNNGAVYNGQQSMGYNVVAFASENKEKKSGTKNRAGVNGVRTLKDGSFVGTWNPVNTLVLSGGKSESFGDMGAVWKGQTVSFTLKTMSNLWNSNDSVEIVPHFSYVDKNGNKTENISVYYHNQKGSGMFINVLDTKRDTASKNLLTTSIGDEMQKGAYYDTFTKPNYYSNWIGYTGSIRGVTTAQQKNTKVPSYSFGRITLNHQLKLYSGEFDQLLENEGNSNPASFVTYMTKDSSWAEDDRFRQSVQSWYGQYYIPNDLFVVNLDEHPAFSLKMHSKDNDPVYCKDGYLIIRFDITVKKNNTDYMRYKTASQDMWSVEGYNTSPAANDPLGNFAGTFSYETGDVIVVDLSKSVKDRYSAGIHKIN